jgi:hypothetical protein
METTIPLTKEMEAEIRQTAKLLRVMAQVQPDIARI